MEEYNSMLQSCFQYAQALKIPLYLQLNKRHFTVDITPFFSRMGFVELSTKEGQEMLGQIEGQKNARILKLCEMTPRVAMNLGQRGFGLGVENITPRAGHFVYRYNEKAILMYSLRAKEWNMGHFNDFAQNKNDISYKMIINRYLAWALLPLGVIGFWGVPIEEGVVVMDPLASLGEAIFIDVRQQKILSADGVSKMPARFKVLKLDATLCGKNISMGREELLSFLTTHSTYFALDGLPIPGRQLIQSLCKISMGLIHPKESFRPRPDLSL